MPERILPDLLIAIAAAGVVAGAAGALRLLSISGAVAAFVVGLFVFGFGGVPYAAALLTFFFSSSILSRIGARRKSQFGDTYAKGARRDAWQVLANGGIPAAIAIASSASPIPRLWTLIFIACVAAANADTWATEIGALAPGKPRLVTTLRKVEPGTSGAISITGLVAALAAAALVVFAARLAWPAHSGRLLWPPDAPEIIAIVWAAFCAAAADSILGASVQAQYRCNECGQATEKRLHCSRGARLVRGWSWMTNDVVNLVSIAFAGACAWALLRYFAYPL